MASSFTTNKGIEQPTAGSYNDTWATPVNADWGIIDTSFGGVTNINVTGLASGSYQFSLQQYQPPNIVFSGNMSGPLVYVFPQGVGGIWSIFNNTNGAFSFVLASAGGSSLYISSGLRSFVVTDGANLQFADTSFAQNAANNAQAAAVAQAALYSNSIGSSAIAQSEAYAQAQDTQVISSCNSYALAVANNAQTQAQNFATTAANNAQATAISTSETYANGSAGSGWTVMPNGKTMMWGSFVSGASSPITVSFPRSGGFPSACESIVVCPVGGPNNWWTSAPSASRTSFTFGFGSNQQYNYMAMGT